MTVCAQKMARVPTGTKYQTQTRAIVDPAGASIGHRCGKHRASLCRDIEAATIGQTVEPCQPTLKVRLGAALPGTRCQSAGAEQPQIVWPNSFFRVIAAQAGAGQFLVQGWPLPTQPIAPSSIVQLHALSVQETL